MDLQPVIRRRDRRPDCEQQHSHTRHERHDQEVVDGRHLDVAHRRVDEDLGRPHELGHERGIRDGDAQEVEPDPRLARDIQGGVSTTISEWDGEVRVGVGVVSHHGTARGEREEESAGDDPHEANLPRLDQDVRPVDARPDGEPDEERHQDAGDGVRQHMRRSTDQIELHMQVQQRPAADALGLQQRLVDGQRCDGHQRLRTAHTHSRLLLVPRQPRQKAQHDLTLVARVAGVRARRHNRKGVREGVAAGR
mmetsp:Transcript_16397/g.53427  ORF Transcript_16397/g.53427 Transcript_16397/m.53427 type:complete len:251 (-) Transcript_16397:1990-2742(-)